ncbi:MAG: hypothetical protein WCT26_03600 [Candidatus Buchananbacteria bacterium]|jgi:hypothetical protein
MREQLSQWIQEAFDDLFLKTNGEVGEHLGRGIIKIKHDSLTRLLPLIKEEIQAVNNNLAITAISSPDKLGFCLINFDLT